MISDKADKLLDDEGIFDYLLSDMQVEIYRVRPKK